MSPAIILAIIKSALKAVPTKEAWVGLGNFNDNDTPDIQVKLVTKSGEEVKFTIDVPFLDIDSAVDALDSLF